MYRITQNGQTIATVDRLQFVRRQRNGVVINCPEAEAHGICVNDAFYHLQWMPVLNGAVDVMVEEFSGVDTIAELDEAVIDLEYQNVLLELGVTENADESAQANH